MKRAVLCLCILVITFASAYADVTVPTYDSYTKIPPESVLLTQNNETATVQCYTDAESIEAYKALLEDSGFLINGSWNLGAGEGYSSIDITAYRYMGKEQPKAFRMTVLDTGFHCHILIQVAYLTSGELFFSMTWSQDISTFVYIWPTPTPQPTIPDGICQYCDQGKCRECNGTGQKRCGICGGSRICIACGGIPRRYVTSYGVGMGFYVECPSCHGDGKCWRCEGSGKEECQSCDGGLCPYCKGDYTNPQWLQ